ncbi:hypothetical protein F5Y04DRAFT_249866 [Hypomontagnella monticulosa]|nr:hypothetical protein F5Y04DRAFT_249866 [Hypomontagnella monticulosa]
MAPLFAILSALLLGVARADQFLNLTALTGRDGISVLECWQLTTPLITSNVPGVAGSATLELGDVANATYTVIPPRFDGGLHHAPVKQYVWFTSGLIHLSLPNATDEVWITGGRYGLVYAEDTADISGWGHRTQYPGSDMTIAMAIPVQDGINPPHTVVHDGPCVAEEQVGI